MFNVIKNGCIGITCGVLSSALSEKSLEWLVNPSESFSLSNITVATTVHLVSSAALCVLLKKIAARIFVENTEIRDQKEIVKKFLSSNLVVLGGWEVGMCLFGYHQEQNLAKSLSLLMSALIVNTVSLCCVGQVYMSLKMQLKKN